MADLFEALKKSKERAKAPRKAKGLRPYHLFQEPEKEGSEQALENVPETLTESAVGITAAELPEIPNSESRPVFAHEIAPATLAPVPTAFTTQLEAIVPDDKKGEATSLAEPPLTETVFDLSQVVTETVSESRSTHFVDEAREPLVETEPTLATPPTPAPLTGPATGQHSLIGVQVDGPVGPTDRAAPEALDALDEEDADSFVEELDSVRIAKNGFDDIPKMKGFSQIPHGLQLYILKKIPKGRLASAYTYLAWEAIRYRKDSAQVSLGAIDKNVILGGTSNAKKVIQALVNAGFVEVSITHDSLKGQSKTYRLPAVAHYLAKVEAIVKVKRETHEVLLNYLKKNVPTNKLSKALEALTPYMDVFSDEQIVEACEYVNQNGFRETKRSAIVDLYAFLSARLERVIAFLKEQKAEVEVQKVTASRFQPAPTPAVPDERTNPEKTELLRKAHAKLESIFDEAEDRAAAIQKLVAKYRSKHALTTTFSVPEEVVLLDWIQN